MIPTEEITTPEKVQKLQRALGRKAKENPRWRAWTLYGDLCRMDVLEMALQSVLRNAGSPGVDGVTTVAAKADAAAFLAGLQIELRERSYRPSPVLRVWIPKDNGKERPLGIPTVKDRVVQTALKLLLEPIFEADFSEYSFGYRPGRSAHQALDAVKKALGQGKLEVIDADLSGYFDTIPHAGLLRLVAGRVSDGAILRLVKLFLRAPIVEENEGKRSTRPNGRGTPQGGPLSPLLSNLYLNSLDHGVNDNPNLWGARLVRFADDFVILCHPGQGPRLYERLKVYLTRKGLQLNEAKSRIVNLANQESFQLLGFEVAWRRSWKTQRFFPYIRPSRKAQQKYRDTLRKELARWTTGQSCAEKIGQVNRIVRGWSNYFHYGNSCDTFSRVQHWTCERLRRWLWEKYDRSLGYYTFFTDDRIYGQYRLCKLPLTAGWTR
jgi:group II intron reverse transcriptase/maturase